jgi:hypothetical protein
MKKLVLLLFFFCLTLQANEYSGLKKLKKKMQRNLNKAVYCLPKETKNGKAEFCTGFSLSKNNLNYLKNMSFNQCKKQVKKKFGFTLSQEIQPRQIKEAEYSKFMNSTKRAQVYYPEKLVLMKQDTGRIDCIHELLHLYQYFSKNKNIHSIFNRKILEDRMVVQLEKHITRVSLLEKKKKIREAQRIGARLQPYIKFLGRFKSQSQWLHEKEIYYFLYKQCGAFKCSVVDKDIALANLYHYRKYFPWRVKDWLIAEAAELIKQKEFLVYKKLAKTWKTHKRISKDQILKMLNTNLEALQQDLKSNGIYFIKNSIFKEGVVCNGNDLIVLYSGELDHALVVAAVMRKEQLKVNKELCSYWPDTRVISKKFNQGIINRVDYEKVVLTSKMAKVLSDQEVYDSLFKYQNLFPTDETSLILERWLNTKTRSVFTIWKNKLPEVFSPGMTIRYSEINDLPMIYVNSRKLVLDLGAMDSVIRPIALSSHELRSMIVLESKTLNTAEGRTQTAPKVMLTTPLVHGGHKLMSTRWVLADLKIIGVDGTFGLNNFDRSEFTIKPKKKIIEFVKLPKKPKSAFNLQSNFRSEFDAIEFKCPEGYIVRVDTGSQVRGDIKPENLGTNYKKNILKCGSINFKGPFEELDLEGPIFSRDVILNLGWPAIREFSIIDISLKEGWINFKE